MLCTCSAWGALTSTHALQHRAGTSAGTAVRRARRRRRRVAAARGPGNEVRARCAPAAAAGKGGGVPRHRRLWAIVTHVQIQIQIQIQNVHGRVVHRTRLLHLRGGEQSVADACGSQRASVHSEGGHGAPRAYLLPDVHKYASISLHARSDACVRA